MAERSPLTRHLCAVCWSVLLGLLGPAGAETSMLTADDEAAWRQLLRIQARVPGFAGFTFSPQEGGLLTVMPLLVFPNLAGQAATVTEQEFDFRALPQAVPVLHSARTLVGAARRVRAAQASARPVVDFGLNRVVVDVPESQLGRLAREWGVPRALLVAREEKPRFEERLVVRGRVTASAPLKGLLWVQVKNVMNRPAVFEYGCGGVLPLGLLTMQGQEVPPDDGFVCTDELLRAILQPGETREFPAFAWRLNAPPAGQYLLKTEQGDFLPLRVWPR